MRGAAGWGRVTRQRKNYGYGRQAQSEKELLDRIRAMYEDMVFPSIPNGLRGCIFTQFSGVERETNGLYTCDQAVREVSVSAMLEIAELARDVLSDRIADIPRTGRANSEYCEHPVALGQQTCREAWAFQQWTKNQSDDPIFKAYRKEYKRRFAWIRAGRISDTEFYAWSEKAREEKKKCDSGALSLEDFTAWLKLS